MLKGMDPVTIHGKSVFKKSRPKNGAERWAEQPEVKVQIKQEVDKVAASNGLTSFGVGAGGQWARVRTQLFSQLSEDEKQRWDAIAEEPVSAEQLEATMKEYVFSYSHGFTNRTYRRNSDNIAEKLTIMLTSTIGIGEECVSEDACYFLRGAFRDHKGVVQKLQ